MIRELKKVLSQGGRAMSMKSGEIQEERKSMGASNDAMLGSSVSGLLGPSEVQIDVEDAKQIEKLGRSAYKKRINQAMNKSAFGAGKKNALKEIMQDNMRGNLHKIKVETQLQ
mmetsp:Transcript_22253/g.16703  ORF Transcript_22253/g.16703 Transcript_22253/m.16703 type:complete len:113 (+) Transcript_22253:2409-2747(+)